MGVTRLPAILLAVLILAALPVQAQPRAEVSAGLNEAAYVHAGLGAIERWERQVYGGTSRIEPVDLNSKLMALLEELTRLHEVSKLPPALPRIKRLLGQYEVPERYGFAAGGMLAAGLQRMDLKNEAFAGYSMFFVRIENRSGAPLSGGGGAEVVLHLPGGGQLSAESISKSHELYPQISRIMSRFQAPAQIAPATEASFIAAFPQAGLELSSLEYATVTYGDHRFVIKCYENLP